MILPNDEECQRILKELENEPTLTEWQRSFVDSNLGRSHFSDRQKEICAEFKAKFEV